MLAAYAMYVPRVILFLSFSFLLIYGGFGVGVLDWAFWGCGFQLMGLWACGVGPSVAFGVRVLYVNIEK
mgnify:CR=1 FL=1